MKRVLVTGAGGFIGSHCLRPFLARGFEVHAVSSRGVKPGPADVHWHQVDLLDIEQADQMVGRVKPSHLLHLAWVTTPGEYWESQENVSWLRASIGLSQAFIRHGGERMVTAGTCAEYDWKCGRCSEATTPLGPVTLYGVSKHCLHLMSTALARDAGLSSAWGRIFLLYGPQEHPQRLVASVVRSLLLGEPALCSYGKQIRDFMYVADVASAFVALVDSDVSGPINIASGRPVVLRELISRIGERIGRTDLIRFGALPSPPGEPALLLGDAGRLHDEVGYSPSTPLDLGIEQTIGWWRANLRSAGIAWPEGVR